MEMTKGENMKNALPYGSKLTSPDYTYTICAVLGSGGFGITYYGELGTRLGNINLKAHIAIKEFFPSSMCERLDGTNTMSYSNPTRDRVEKSRRDFLGEARRLNRLAGRHPNIVTVNEVFEANNTAYYVMEYLDGVSLKKYIETNGPISESEMLALMAPVVSAVAFLHNEHITHLDIKPANIMITGGFVDQPIRPVLIDFGLSKHYDTVGNPTSTLNDSGYTDGFAPREQYGGITTFSPSADVYSLGATMLFCLTGRRLPSSLSLTDNDIRTEIPATVSPRLREALLGALALHASERIPDAGILLKALPVAKDNALQSQTQVQPKQRSQIDFSKMRSDHQSESIENSSKLRHIGIKWIIAFMVTLLIVAAVVFIIVRGYGEKSSPILADTNSVEYASEAPVAPESETVAENPADESPAPYHDFPSEGDLHCVMKDGQNVYFNQEEWKGYPDSEKKGLKPKGIVVLAKYDDICKLEPFALALHDLNSGQPITWLELRQTSMINKLPNKKQYQELDRYKSAEDKFNEALIAYGGDALKFANYWGAEGDYSDNYGWYAADVWNYDNAHDRKVGGSNVSDNEYYVRAVYNLPITPRP